MDKNMSYTINFKNTPDNLKLFMWLSQQNNPDEFILRLLKEAMNNKSENKKQNVSYEDVEILFNDDDFWK